MSTDTTARPCPQCGGADRFYFLPHSYVANGPAWHCRRCGWFKPESGTTAPAPDELSEDDQQRARVGYAAAAAYGERLLWANEGREALAHLRSRGFTDETIREARLGYHPSTWNSEGLGDTLFKSDRAAYDGAKIGGLLGVQGQAASVLRETVTLPYWHGETCALVRGRALDRNRAAKYLSPSGVRLYAGAPPVFFLHDVLDQVRADGNNRENAVILTEGELKALAAWQAWHAGELSMPAVATPGISYLPDALIDALAGMTVYLVYDSERRADPFELSAGERYTLTNGRKLLGWDRAGEVSRLEREHKAATKAGDEERAATLATRLAEARELAERAKARNIRVKVVRLPRAPDAEKIDLDAFLLERGAAQLQQILDSAPDFRLWHRAHNGGGYRFDRWGGTWKGDQQLANYQARIVEDVAKHDGEDAAPHHRLALRTPSGRVVYADIPGEVWADPRRALEAMRRALMEGTALDEGREALKAFKLLSAHGDAPAQRVIYAATGWQQIGGRWHYLAPDGAITADGPTTTTRAHLGDAATGNHYALCGEGDPAEGARAFLSLLRGDVCPQPLALVLAGHAALPLLHRFTGHSNRPTVWIHGESGNQKTSLLRAFLSLYGPRFTAERADGAPLAKWEATYNGLERLAYDYRDVLFAIDDYKPATCSPGTLARFLHSSSESSSRSRMGRDLSQQRGFPARGVMVATGEDRPTNDTGQIGRILPYEVRRGDVDLDALAAVQRAGEAGHLAAFWREFVQVIACDLDNQGEDAIGDALHDLMSADEEQLPGHARAVGAMRQNRAAFLVLMKWLRRAGYVTAEEAAALVAAHAEARHVFAENQARAMHEERPADVFLSVLSEMLTTGEMVLLGSPFDGTLPAPDCPPERELGFFYEARDGTRAIALHPKTAFRLVSRAQRDAGAPIRYSESAVREQLDNGGHLVRTSNGRSTHPVRHPVTGKVTRVLLLSPASLMPAEDDVTDVTAEESAAVTSGYVDSLSKNGGELDDVTDVTDVTATFRDVHENGASPPENRLNGHTVPKTGLPPEQAVTSVTSGYKPDSLPKNGGEGAVTNHGAAVTSGYKPDSVEIERRALMAILRKDYTAARELAATLPPERRQHVEGVLLRKRVGAAD